MVEGLANSKPDYLSGARVLIVDDLKDNVDIIAKVVEGKGCTTLCANSGEEALHVIDRTEPDVAIVDVVMPGMNGIEFCKRLRETFPSSFIPTILVSGQVDDGVPVEALEAGAVDFIAKPIHMPLLVARLRNSMEMKRLHEEVTRYKEKLQDNNDRLEERIRVRTNQLTATQQVTAFSLARLSESRDTETGAHLERIRLYVRILAETLSTHKDFSQVIDSSYIDRLYFSSPLHDIGKVGIPDEILLKPGKLSREEFEIMKWHTIIGGETLEEADHEAGKDTYLEMARDIAFAHHEKWGGTGYPRGLKGEAIPLSARIVALADVYDALSSKRPYKEAMDHETTKRIVLEGRDEHFDPRVVDAFLTAEQRFIDVRNAHADLDDGVPRLQRIMEDLDRMRKEGT